MPKHRKLVALNIVHIHNEVVRYKKVRGRDLWIIMEWFPGDTIKWKAKY